MIQVLELHADYGLVLPSSADVGATWAEWYRCSRARARRYAGVPFWITRRRIFCSLRPIASRRP